MGAALHARVRLAMKLHDSNSSHSFYHRQVALRLAHSTGVRPNLSFASTSAPCAVRNLTTSRWPSFAAQCSGVEPCSPLAFTSASFASKNSTIFRWPFSAAPCTVVEPRLDLAFTSAPDDTRCCTISTYGVIVFVQHNTSAHMGALCRRLRNGALVAGRSTDPVAGRLWHPQAGSSRVIKCRRDSVSYPSTCCGAVQRSPPTIVFRVDGCSIFTQMLCHGQVALPCCNVQRRPPPFVLGVDLGTVGGQVLGYF